MPKRLWLVGAVAGVVSGMLGVGGGLVIGPALILLGMPLRRAGGTALALIPFIAAAAVIAEVLLEPQNIYPGLASAVFLGGIVGVKLGAIIDKAIAPHCCTIYFCCCWSLLPQEIFMRVLLHLR